MEARVIGMMSGSSMDGLDMADCTFNLEVKHLKFSVNSAITFDYPDEIQNGLSLSPKMTQEDFSAFNSQYSYWVAKKIKGFIPNSSKVELLGLHGHTVFHEPARGFSKQLGDGNIIFSETKIPTVTDFRNADIAAGGQGAPLSPKGDLDLFSEYEAFLNLGGISNFSRRVDHSSILGFDICPFNLALNEGANKAGLKFDKNGNLASKGNMIADLLQELNKIPFYQINQAKSIDRIWYEENFLPILNDYFDTHSPEDILHTLVHHQSFQIAEVLNRYLTKGDKVLVSGGGAHNGFFISFLRSKLKPDIIIPNSEIVDYKEAIIFAYLALLRALKRPNSLAKVTGAREDSIGGEIFGNWNTN